MLTTTQSHSKVVRAQLLVCNERKTIAGEEELSRAACIIYSEMLRHPTKG
jgi:hypothetical protein